MSTHSEIVQYAIETVVASSSIDVYYILASLHNDNNTEAVKIAPVENIPVINTEVQTASETDPSAVTQVPAINENKITETVAEIKEEKEEEKEKEEKEEKEDKEEKEEKEEAVVSQKDNIKAAIESVISSSHIDILSITKSIQPKQSIETKEEEKVKENKEEKMEEKKEEIVASEQEYVKAAIESVVDASHIDVLAIVKSIRPEQIIEKQSVQTEAKENTAERQVTLIEPISGSVEINEEKQQSTEAEVADHQENKKEIQSTEVADQQENKIKEVEEEQPKVESVPVEDIKSPYVVDDRIKSTDNGVQEAISSVINSSSIDIQVILKNLEKIGEVRKIAELENVSQSASVPEIVKVDESVLNKIEEIKEEPQVEEIKEEPQVEEIKEEPQVEESKEEPRVEEIKEESQVEEIKEEPRVEEIKEEPRVEEIKEEPRVEEIKEEPQVEESKEEPQVEESKEIQKEIINTQFIQETSTSIIEQHDAVRKSIEINITANNDVTVKDLPRDNDDSKTVEPLVKETAEDLIRNVKPVMNDIAKEINSTDDVLAKETADTQVSPQMVQTVQQPQPTVTPAIVSSEIPPTVPIKTQPAPQEAPKNEPKASRCLIM